ncbi:kinase-like domain-containing protein [Xylariaceae sp. FL1651]|nr:kinase-like domain-containing protein [Xylariaceae sp. FL1651]
MPPSQPLSDLVRDSKIETEVSDTYTQHTFYRSGNSARERLVRRVERWVRETSLGKGAYGTVYRERCEQRGSQKLRAVKEIKKYVVVGEEVDYTRELEAIAKFSHPKYSHCFVRSDGWYEVGDTVFITMEYLELGDLQRYLSMPLPESEARDIASQILEGLKYMHENGFIHRDLKPGNILVVTKGPDWFVKIADFGISKRRQQGITTLHTLQRGTFGFAAPEVLGLQPDDSASSYTFAVDLWSLGAVIYRMLTNTIAFQNFAELFKYSKGELKFPIANIEACDISEHGQDFIAKLMSPMPDARLSAASACNHPWILSPPIIANKTPKTRPAKANFP